MKDAFLDELIDEKINGLIAPMKSEEDTFMYLCGKGIESGLFCNSNKEQVQPAIKALL